MSILDDIVGFFAPAAPVVVEQKRAIDAAVKQSVEANPTWVYPGATVDLPAGRAEQFARERTTTSTASAAAPQPGASQVPVLWLLGLGGVALWWFTKKR